MAELDDPEAFDLNDFLKKDLDMHELWFRATDKMFLWQQLTDPQADYSRFIRLDMVGAKNVPDVIKDHTRMMEIIDAKDESAIEPLLTHHLYGGVRRLGGQDFFGRIQHVFPGGGPVASAMPGGHGVHTNQAVDISAPAAVQYR